MVQLGDCIPQCYLEQSQVTDGVFAARAWSGPWGRVLVLGSEMFVRAFDEDASSCARQMESVIWTTLGRLSASFLG